MTAAALEPVWWRSRWNRWAGVAEYCGWQGATLSVDRLLDSVRKEMKCGDFNDLEFVPPLELLLRDFHANAGADVLGRRVFARMLEVTLSTRLRIESALRSFPEIANETVRPPLFIVGMPRTGSTLLQGLLAGVPGMRTPLRWETELRTAPPGVARPRDLRWQRFRADLRVRAANSASPGLRQAHEIGSLLPEECNPLLMTSMRSLFFGLFFDCPDYEDDVYANDFRGAYEWHKRHLQVLAYRQPAATWLLKGPLHLGSLAALLRVYPGARVVFTHRDPIASFASMVSLVASLRALISPVSDRVAIGRWLLASLARMQDAAESTRTRWPRTSPPFVDVRYADLVGDPVATLRGILRHFGVAVPDDLQSIVDRYLQGHRQHRHGKHAYALDDSGVDADHLRSVFGRAVGWLESSRPAADGRGRDANA